MENHQMLIAVVTWIAIAKRVFNVATISTNPIIIVLSECAHATVDVYTTDEYNVFCWVMHDA